jgi:hypothetical protein
MRLLFCGAAGSVITINEQGVIIFMKKLLLPLIICFFYFITFFIIVPVTAFPLRSEINNIDDLSRYNDIYDFRNFKIVDTKTLPYSTLFLLHDTEHQELLLLQAEKYLVYSRYRFILNPQPIFSDRSMALDDFVYKMDVRAMDRRLVVDRHFSPNHNTIAFLLLGLLCILLLVRSVAIKFVEIKK